ncbi:MAG: amidohydrolase [Methylococcaceae bacterium]|nr:amidohydrolase [Methylococcaceae bacterium]
MQIPEAITQLHPQMLVWRRHLHRYPETAYEEVQTADFIAQQLRDFGFIPHTGLAKTGVVASLSVGASTKTIALRADMDALHIHEHNEFAYKSTVSGKMHACGHDGHSAMLLGAAKHLVDTQQFDGTVHFIFQPAEEGRAGAQQMLAEGLFEQFPSDCVFGLHNFPNVPVGHFAIKAGPMMAALNCFEITLTGKACHAAKPHLGQDPMIAAAQLIMALQTIVSRNVNPHEPAVVSVTQIHSGQTWNAIPEEVTLRGTYRCFEYSVQQLLERRLQELTETLSMAFNVTGQIVFNPENPGYPVTSNSIKETAIAVAVATAVVGEQAVDLNPVPSMGSEDFAFMLQQKPGCYVWLGNGNQPCCGQLHNPHYDFNDDILPIGAAYWVKLVETVLNK